MSRIRIVCLVVFASTACRDLAVKDPVASRPGTLRATLVTALPGRLELSPAAGAVMQVSGTTLRATADAEGNVLLEGLTASTGRLLITFDSNGDGRADRSRAYDLARLAVGPDRDVSLGTVVLGRNATVSGAVLRGDLQANALAHFGIAVFLPEGPQLTYSSASGAFVLESVPEGPATVAFFAEGYAPETLSLEARAGEEVRTDTVALARLPTAPLTGSLTALVTQSDGTPLSQVSATVARNGVTAATVSGADGRFTFSGLSIGVYALALTKAGFNSLRVDNLLVVLAENPAGPFVLTPGTSTPIELDGGVIAPPTPDGGAGDGGTPDSGTPDSGTPDSGTPDSGTPDSGTPDSGTPDSGTPDAGAPVAIARGPQFALPGSQVTLDGTASTGDQPLTYSWTVLPPNASLMLSSNNSITAFNPRFTAPALGTLVEVSLTVTDRLGRASTNAATVRVPIAGAPTARFLPDAGSFLGSDTITLTSTSTDDAGLLITGYTWAQTPAVPGTVLTPNGSTASLTFPPVTSTPVVVGVELTVTNSAGVASAPTRRTYVANPGTMGNWTLAAAVSSASPLVYTGANPPQQLTATVSTNVQSPQLGYAWSCTNLATSLSNANTAVADFLVPVVEGPDVTVSCQVTVTATAPLDPPMRTASVGFILRDGKLPALVRTRPNASDVRASPFGVFLEATEPFSLQNVANNGCAMTTSERVGRQLLLFSNTMRGGATCGSFLSQLVDGAGNNTNTLTHFPAFTTSPAWKGPYVSTALYDDPRPLLASLGPLPYATQGLYPVASPPLPFELVARQGTNLVTFGVDLLNLQACSPDCPFSGTQTPLAGLDPLVPAPLGVRSARAGAELLVALQQNDAGLPGDTLYARRSATGMWSALPVSGELFNGVTNDEARRVRVIDGGVVSDVFDPATSTFLFPELVAPAGSPVVTLSGGDSRQYSRNPVITLTRADGTIEMYARSAASSSWGASNGAVASSNVLYTRVGEAFGFLGLRTKTIAIRSVAPQVATYDSSIRAVNSLGPVNGFDVLQRLNDYAAVVSQNGDLRLYVGDLGNSSGTYPGPPRAVPLAPGDDRLDLDPACEAAFPRVAFIEDALAIVWQERCAPETKWRIALRIIQ